MSTESASSRAEGAGFSEAAQPAFEHSGTRVPGSDTAGLGTPSFTTYLVSKLHWIYAALLLGGVVGLVLANMFPPSYSASARLGFANPAEFLPVRYLIGGVGATEEQRASDSIKLTRSVLEARLQSPAFFANFAAANPELFPNEDGTLGAAEFQTMYFNSVKIAKDAGDSPTPDDSNTEFVVTFRNADAERTQAVLQRYLDHVVASVNATIPVRLREIMESRVVLAEASFLAAKKSRDANFKTLEDVLLDDISIARRAGFEKPAFNLQASEFGDTPLANVMPRYFFGTEILEEQLKVLRENKLNPNRIPEFLQLEELKDRSEAFLTAIGSRNLNLVSYAIEDRPSQLPYLLVNFILVIIGAFGLALLSLFVLFQIHLLRTVKDQG